MFRYDPPSHIDDLADRSTQQAFLDDWHNFIYNETLSNIETLRNPVDDKQNLVDTPIPQPLFFSEVDTSATSTDIPVPWNGFPLVISRRFPNDPKGAWAFAEQLQSTKMYTPPHATEVTTRFRPQDEYLEWHVYRDGPAGAISRVVFTCEAPEYWIKLAHSDFDQVVSLYQKFVSSKVTKEDLKLKTDIQFENQWILRKNTYNPFNVWNTEAGVMHLTHYANTLGAEINLAARATALRRDPHGARVTETRRLICCSGFGSANRSSDPTIGQAVNLTALGSQSGAIPQAVTLANPVALYMNKLKSTTLSSVNGDPKDDWFRFARGIPGRGLMAVVAPPTADAGGFEQLLVNGAELVFGGQIAEAIGMVLYAKTASFAGPMPPLGACVYHCCVGQTVPPEKIDQSNLGQSDKGDACGQGTKEAYPEVAPPAAAGLALTRTGPIWRKTRLERPQ